MLADIDPTAAAVAARIVEIQLAAYAVEAALIGFDGIPQLSETADQVRSRTDLRWHGAFDDDGRLVGLIAWEAVGGIVDIDRLAIDPLVARRGWGRRLVQAVPRDQPTIVSTGTENEPATNLYRDEGFVEVGRTEVAPGVFTTQFRRPAG